MPERLVAHAVRLLDEAGAEVVTVREVARRAGVSPGAPFRHFPHPHRFALLRGALFGADRAPALEEGHRAFTRSLIELIVAGQQRVELRQADTELIRIAAQALVFGLSQMFVDDYLDASRADTLINQVVDLFGLGVLAPGSDRRDAN
ncbi:helix-turn-helix domain-containing protein [Streptomyces anulatus]|uniref:TetR/AcrR family transcriptional regulator n=1 Tax=Streptomyces anulatus TaxID=1892 RepID=UPI003423AD40